MNERNITNMKWVVHLEGGPRRVNHAAVPINDKIYSFGGYCTGEDYETTTPMDVHVLDTVSFRWKLLTVSIKPSTTINVSIPYQRYGHSAVAFEENAYIWGGRNDRNGACNVLFQFSTEKNQWQRVDTGGSIPGARDGHTACVINQRMYLFGGYEDAVDRFSDEIFHYEFATRTWTYVRTEGIPAKWRDFHTAIGIGNIMYVFGGRSDVGGDIFTNREIYYNKIQTFDTINKRWHEPVTEGTTPLGRRSHSAFIYDGCMYIFGGYNGIKKQHFDEIYKFDPATNKWSKIIPNGQGPCSRRRQCCCLVNNRVFLFGGTSPVSEEMSVNEHEDETSLMDHSDLHVLDLEPSLKTLSQLAVLKHKLDITLLPKDLRYELKAMTTPNNIFRPINSNG